MKDFAQAIALFFKNKESLDAAIKAAGGEGVLMKQTVEVLLTTLAANSIEITASYKG